MCQVSIGEVLEVRGKSAKVNFRGRKIEVKADLIADLKPGEFVSFSSGIAIEKMSKEDAAYICG